MVATTLNQSRRCASGSGCVDFDVRLKMTRRRKIVTFTFTLIALSAGYAYFGRIESSKSPSPDGKYFAIVSHRPMYYIPLPIYRWGNHSDSPVFVSIEDSKGNQCGEVPVPMMQMACVDWSINSASIPSVAEWDFSAGTCYYWSGGGTSAIFTKQN